MRMVMWVALFVFVCVVCSRTKIQVTNNCCNCGCSKTNEVAVQTVEYDKEAVSNLFRPPPLNLDDCFKSNGVDSIKASK
jgi:hypothetical protein